MILGPEEVALLRKVEKWQKMIEEDVKFLASRLIPGTTEALKQMKQETIQLRQFDI